MSGASTESSRLMKQAGMAIVGICFWSGLVFGAQRAQRRVFSNEDVQSPPPVATAPSEPAGGAASAPEATPPAATEGSKTGAPQGDLKRAFDLQAVLNQAFDELQFKLEREQDPELQKRWTSMTVCMRALLQANQLTINELQQQPGSQSAAGQQAAAPQSQPQEQPPSAPQ